MPTELVLNSRDLSVGLSTQGGVLTLGTAYGLPFLRRANGAGPTESAGFPMVPLCNRVSGNSFQFAGRTHVLTPNAGDPLYLHGDGWLGLWHLVRQDEAAATMAYDHEIGPFRYRAVQEISLTADSLHLKLGVENRGDAAMPFGLGFHPYFPRSRAKIAFSAAARWTEGPNHLPHERQVIARGTSLQPLPNAWENNAYDGWNGLARIFWPGLELTLEADPLFNTLMIYAPGEDQDFFCLEPMSHLPDALNLPGQPGLKVLAPGEALSGVIRMRLTPLETPND